MTFGLACANSFDVSVKNKNMKQNWTKEFFTLPGLDSLDYTIF